MSSHPAPSRSAPDRSPLPRRGTAAALDPWLIGGVHIAVAILYWAWAGVTITWDPNPDHWSWFDQNIASDLLESRLLESLWYSHAQPPLWNMLGGLLLKVFGTAQLGALHALHVLLGAAMAGLCLSTTVRVTGSRRWSWVAGLVVALHPALFLFEAYALYTTLSAFLVVLAAWLLAHLDDRRRDLILIGFVSALVGLILTRSVFHLILLVGAAPLLWAERDALSRAQRLVVLLVVLAPMGWYTKNHIQYGFFGSSSWHGMGLWRSALFEQDPDLLQRLFDEGSLSPVVSRPPFSPPSAYADLGFQARSEVPVLSRDDQYNVNVPAVSSDYRGSALALIRRSPGRYLSNVLVAYGNFSAPSTGYPHLATNRERIGVHAALEEWLLMRPLVAALEPAAGGGYYGSVYFLLIPIVLGLFTGSVVRGTRSPREWPGRLRADPATAFIALLVLYTTVVSCTMELGENVRFKFLIEPAFLTLTVILAARWTSRLDPASPDAEAERQAGDGPVLEGLG